MPEKLCVRWNDFKDNINSSFRGLREENDFADVTLACEDGEQLKAHRVILAALSPFFQNLLRKIIHPHPLIFMRGVKYEDLLAIVDFLYCGEANVHQENLESFLAVAEELQVKGLMGEDSEEKTLPKRIEPTIKRESKASNSNNKPLNKEKSKSVSLTSPLNGELQDLNEKVKAMLEKTQNVQLSKSSRSIHGGAYFSAVSG